MNLNFKEMSSIELKAYILINRDNDEAFEEYRRRLRPSSPTYSFTWTEEGTKQMEEVFRQKIQEIEDRRPPAGQQ